MNSRLLPLALVIALLAASNQTLSVPSAIA
jgi:hypothetical protein